MFLSFRTKTFMALAVKIFNIFYFAKSMTGSNEHTCTAVLFCTGVVTRDVNSKKNFFFEQRQFSKIFIKKTCFLKMTCFFSKKHMFFRSTKQKLLFENYECFSKEKKVLRAYFC